MQEQGNKAVGYVKATAGERFTVEYVDLRTSTPTAYMTAVYVDDADAESLLTARTDICFGRPSSDETRYAVAEGIRISPTAVRPFVFPSPPSTSTAAPALQGTIRLMYWRVKNIKATMKAWSPLFDHGREGKGKGKGKAADPAPITTQKIKGSTFDYVDGESKPHFVLELRYRDEASLRRAGHISAKPSFSTSSLTKPAEAKKRKVVARPPTPERPELPLYWSSHPIRYARPLLSDEEGPFALDCDAHGQPVRALSPSSTRSSPSMIIHSPSPQGSASSSPFPVSSYAGHLPTPTPAPANLAFSSKAGPPASKATTASSSTFASAKNANGSGSGSGSNASKKRRLAAMKAELESLKRQERIAKLEMEIEEMEQGGGGGSGDGHDGGQAGGGKRMKVE
ncbi:hypothetical protein JCM6882_005806 [Rhodosporidiobolus microsporus]